MNRWRWLALVLALMLVVAACGGDDDDADDDGGDTATTAAADAGGDEGAASGEDVTLRVLIHSQEPMNSWVQDFSRQFEADNPGVTVDVSIVAADELATVTNSRLSANDIDVIDMFGFANPVQDYMGAAEPPGWQTMIEAGLLLDITDEPWVQNYDQPSIEQAGTFDGRVYSVNLGRVVYGGMFVNSDLLAEVGVDIPTTWSELVSVCEAVKAAGNECMTNGGADGWPIFVGTYGLLGSLFPDQEALVEGLYTGAITWDSPEMATLWERYKIYAQEMLEAGTTGLAHDAATFRFAAGDVAFLPTGNWQAANLENEAAFGWSYVPFPGSDNAADNEYLFGKYDQGWAIAADSPNVEVAKAYVAAFSEPATYQDFVTTVGFIPTQPTATLETTIGQALAPYLENYQVGFEQYWVQPSGAGQWANGSNGAAWFQPFNEWEDPAALATQAQIDLQAALDEL
ncbi:MAG TPA: ABC transporter substrate-binding protein [Acidimicrobiia bacterium]|jgi:raffinose/stachyose/melibiose transport system substrate-binding protein|nr:ABC transporter substrate-binding protein [Acidimicrobiia bacterium]